MKEIDVLVTVRYREVDGDITDAVEWSIDKLGEDVYNIGYDYDDLHVRSRIVERREVEDTDD